MEDYKPITSSITLKIMGHLKETSVGVSISFEAYHLSVIVLVASVLTFTLLGAFLAVCGRIVGQYLRLTS